MRDEAITTPPGITLAEAAVSYLLQRLRVDADLRYHMLDTEAFARLCRAEAQRAGVTAEQTEAFYSALAEHCRKDKPKLVQCRELIERIGEVANEGRSSASAALDACEEIYGLCDRVP